MALELIDPKKYRQLFLDDFAVEKMTGVHRTLHQPEKVGPVVRPDRSRGETALQSRISPQWNSEMKRWEWWFGNDFGTSADGRHWERFPQKVVPSHAVRDERDPDPRRRYKGLLGSSHNNDQCPAFSADGIEWERLDVPPIPSQDEHQFTYDPYGDRYIAMVKHGTEWGRSVFLASSEDGVRYSDPELIFHTDEIDRENRRKRVREVLENPAYIKPAFIDDVDYIAEAYHMAVMPYEGFYIGFPLIFNPIGAVPPPHTNFTRINQIELAVSRDLHHWERVADRALFIGIEPWDGKRYDTNQVGMSGQPVVREDGEIWIYYIGSRIPSRKEQYERYNHNQELFRLGVDPDLFNDSTTICLAKLPPDRFVSLDAEAAGTITSKPFIWRGEDLYVNVDARWGELYAEILDAESNMVFPGFWVPAELPAPLRGDHLRAKVEWKPDHDLVFEKPVRVRFYLHQARLFSFWLE